MIKSKLRAGVVTVAATTALVVGGLSIAAPANASPVKPASSSGPNPVYVLLYPVLNPFGLSELADPNCIGLLIAEIGGYHDGCASA